MATKTIVYVDGFNLYYGALKGTPYKWLDLEALFSNVLARQHEVVAIKYFTAKVAAHPNNPGIDQRQTTYLNALQATCPLVHVYLGHYSRKRVRRENVNPPPPTVDVWNNEEKGSDVNLAVQLVNDAWLGAYDAAVVVSNDADLAAGIELARAQGKAVGLVVPGYNRKKNPKRWPVALLKQRASFVRQLRDSALAAYQMSQQVNSHGGAVIVRPTGW